MIAVIADDFTGAAEIGGIGLRRGLRVVIETAVKEPNGTDLLVVTSDTRSMIEAEAYAEINQITKKLVKLAPDYVFKKLDSVLRGNIVAELKAQMKECGIKRALVVAGNPHFNRIIKNGIYYVNGALLSETFFANDPQYPTTTSDVWEILGSDKDVKIVSVGSDLPAEGVLIANVTNNEDLDLWVKKSEDDLLLAGGAGFFDVIINRDHPQIHAKKDIQYHLGKKTLFVFGSTYPKSDKFLKQLQSLGMYVSNMPDEIYYNNSYDDAIMDMWASNVKKELIDGRKIVVTIDQVPANGYDGSKWIKEQIGVLIQKVISEVDIDDLLIEGGDTTSAILKLLGITKLEPFCELGHGVIQMRADKFPNMCITTKPGSYFWPEEIILNGENDENK
jgi:uncharacterized protein YgbK (DUF1537 family)